MSEVRQDGDLSRRGLLRSAGLLVLTSATAPVLAACGAADGSGNAAAQLDRGSAVTLWRQEGCSCCATYAGYLRDNGFTVEMKTVEDLRSIRERYGIPDPAVGCHTSVIGEYVVEGHVPVEAIDRLLGERPSLEGISVVGMPTNSPGMGDPDGRPLEVLSFEGGRVAPYMTVTTY